jgi:hypothetical protein
MVRDVLPDHAGAAAIRPDARARRPQLPLRDVRGLYGELPRLQPAARRHGRRARERCVPRRAAQVLRRRVPGLRRRVLHRAELDRRGVRRHRNLDRTLLPADRRLHAREPGPVLRAGRARAFVAARADGRLRRSRPEPAQHPPLPDLVPFREADVAVGSGVHGRGGGDGAVRRPHVSHGTACGRPARERRGRCRASGPAQWSVGARPRGVVRARRPAHGRARRHDAARDGGARGAPGGGGLPDGRVRLGSDRDRRRHRSAFADQSRRAFDARAPRPGRRLPDGLLRAGARGRRRLVRPRARRRRRAEADRSRVRPRPITPAAAIPTARSTSSARSSTRSTTEWASRVSSTAARPRAACTCFPTSGTSGTRSPRG